MNSIFLISLLNDIEFLFRMTRAGSMENSGSSAYRLYEKERQQTHKHRHTETTKNKQNLSLKMFYTYIYILLFFSENFL